MYEEQVKKLRYCGNAISCIHCPYWEGCGGSKEDLMQAADAIEELQKALILMVLQYCTTDDGLLYNSFMSAGENAFAVLGLENGQQAEPLWDRLFVQKPPKPKSNANRIRNMDDYDLAIFLENVSCAHADTESWFDWLKEPIEEGE